MSEPESRKYARKVGCVLAPIWMPLYFVSAIVGLICGTLWHGFLEGISRYREIYNSMDMWDGGDGK